MTRKVKGSEIGEMMEDKETGERSQGKGRAAGGDAAKQGKWNREDAAREGKGTRSSHQKGRAGEGGLMP